MNLLVIALLGPLLLQQSPDAPAAIDGVVVRAGTMQPISRAAVELIRSGKTVSATETAADGRFRFRHVPAGRYRITVTRNGYLNSAYGQRGPNGSGTSLELRSGQPLQGVRITMVAPGADLRTRSSCRPRQAPSKEASSAELESRYPMHRWFSLQTPHTGSARACIETASATIRTSSVSKESRPDSIPYSAGKTSMKASGAIPNSFEALKARARQSAWEKTAARPFK